MGDRLLSAIFASNRGKSITKQPIWRQDSDEISDIDSTAVADVPFLGFGANNNNQRTHVQPKFENSQQHAEQKNPKRRSRTASRQQSSDSTSTGARLSARFGKKLFSLDDSGKRDVKNDVIVPQIQVSSKGRENKSIRKSSSDSTIGVNHESTTMLLFEELIIDDSLEKKKQNHEVPMTAVSSGPDFGEKDKRSGSTNDFWLSVADSEHLEDEESVQPVTFTALDEEAGGCNEKKYEKAKEYDASSKPSAEKLNATISGTTNSSQNKSSGSIQDNVEGESESNDAEEDEDDITFEPIAADETTLRFEEVESVVRLSFNSKTFEETMTAVLYRDKNATSKRHVISNERAHSSVNERGTNYEFNNEFLSFERTTTGSRRRASIKLKQNWLGFINRPPRNTATSPRALERKTSSSAKSSAAKPVLSPKNKQLSRRGSAAVSNPTAQAVSSPNATHSVETKDTVDHESTPSRAVAGTEGASMVSTGKEKSKEQNRDVRFKGPNLSVDVQKALEFADEFEVEEIDNTLTLNSAPVTAGRTELGFGEDSMLKSPHQQRPKSARGKLNEQDSGVISRGRSSRLTEAITPRMKLGTKLRKLASNPIPEQQPPSEPERTENEINADDSAESCASRGLTRKRTSSRSRSQSLGSSLRTGMRNSIGHNKLKSFASGRPERQPLSSSRGTLHSGSSDADLEAHLDCLRLSVLKELPAVGPVDFDHDRIVVHEFSLLHNALRSEIIELLVILSLFEENLAHVIPWHASAFFTWFTEFKSFVEHAIAVQDEVLYPWLETGYINESTLQPDLRRKRVNDFMEKFNQVEKQQGLFFGGGAKNVFQRIHENVNDVCQCLLEWMQFTERELQLLPCFILSPLPRIDSRVFAFFMQSKQAALMLPMYLHWMESSALGKAWMMRNITGTSRVIYKIWRKGAERSHFRMAFVFCETLIRTKMSKVAAPNSARAAR
eukprot:CAMPEP_0182443112 /NCGR_PEP_ID=MMETSP1172-20130603/1926_1 /TAXON_ID=708627 /ORGANISM="Timspurckia oligopyrenoides, Strain CCMP3278" /LENGTH=953 /DNA_ID=CAMNT_0024638279 /DNA_START=95 /DNA_END=2956 /DNA_ORIENTATION=+